MDIIYSMMTMVNNIALYIQKVAERLGHESLRPARIVKFVTTCGDGC